MDLGTAVGTAGALNITGPLGDVQVSDQRAGVLGWDASAVSTDFTGTATGSKPILASTIGYTPGEATVVGTATVSQTT